MLRVEGKGRHVMAASVGQLPAASMMWARLTGGKNLEVS